MIRKIQIGKAEDVTQVLFENGDIMMTRVQLDDGAFSLTINEHEQRPIGDITNEYAGKNTDVFPSEVKVCLSFTNAKSLNALIHSLVELQSDLLNGELKGGKPVTE